MSSAAGAPSRGLPSGARLALALLFLAGASFASRVRAAGLTGVEQRIVASVDRATPGALQLLERVVNVNSGTMNFAGVREVGRLFEQDLQALGFATRWADGAAFGRAGHLIAHWPADGHDGSGPRVLLIGHLDTVFESDSPFQKFVRTSDSTAAGPGVCDMKGGDLVILTAMRALKDVGALARMSVTIVFSGDEERAGLPLALARKDLIDAAEWADVAIGFEDGPSDPHAAVIARRGASNWALHTAGVSSHSGQIFSAEVGIGAIYEAARVLQAFRDSLAREPYLTLSPGVIVGGTEVGFDADQNRGTAFGKTNVVAESTSVAGDLRTLTPEQREHAIAVMQRIVANHGPRASGTIVFDDGYPPLAPTDGNRRLLALFDGASRDLGYGAVSASDPARAGAADVSFTSGHVAMAMDGVGLMGGGDHTVHEVGDLNSLAMNAKRIGVTLARLAAEWKTK